LVIVIINQLLIIILIFSGGLTAVIFTDVLQCVIMILGAITLAILSKLIIIDVADAKKIKKKTKPQTIWSLFLAH